MESKEGSVREVRGRRRCGEGGGGGGEEVRQREEEKRRSYRGVR